LASVSSHSPLTGAAARSAAALVAVALPVLAYKALTAAKADLLAETDEPAAITEAVDLAPGNAEYARRLAILDRPRAPGLLETATRANPMNPAGWIERGLASEARGRIDEAERFLLEAAAWGRTYTPRWSLANFYLRNERETQFFFWAGECLKLKYSDPHPIFHLAWRVAPDGKTLLDQLKPEGTALSALLGFLLAKPGAAGTVAVANRVVSRRDPIDVPALHRAVDRLMQVERLAEAAGLWNSMSAARLHEFPAILDASPAIVNGSFRSWPESKAFDWHITPGDHISISANPGLRFAFSGRQPDGSVPLWQVVPVRGNANLRLEIAYRTEGIRSDAGLEWAIRDSAGRKMLARQKVDPAESLATTELLFDVPGDCQGVRIQLRCDRRPGTVRASGALTLESVKLEVRP
jgi:hypothetical protein